MCLVSPIARKSNLSQLIKFLHIDEKEDEGYVTFLMDYLKVHPFIFTAYQVSD